MKTTLLTLYRRSLHHRAFLNFGLRPDRLARPGDRGPGPPEHRRTRPGRRFGRGLGRLRRDLRWCPLRAFLNQTLAPGKEYNDSLHYLDPSKLKLTTAADTRVYFVGEGAGYHNSLGFNTTGSGVASGDPKLMFPDASSPVSTSSPSWNGVQRTASEPLLPGDFVDLGNNAAGTLLNFFLISNGANGGKSVFSTNTATNPDGINHVVAFTTPGSPYLMIGFEDMYGGGDRDFNDEIIAVDIGATNLRALSAAPEPAMWLVLASFLLPVVWLKKRRAAAEAELSSLTAA